MVQVSFVFIDEGHVSDDYVLSGPCINDGAKTVKKSADWIGYRVNVDDRVGEVKSFADAKVRAQAALESKPIGTTVRLQAVVKSTLKVKDRVNFKKIRDNPIVNTPGVEGIDRFVGWIEAHKSPGDNVRYAGICVCKHPSDHADCAAVDVFATNTFMKRMKAEALRNPQFYHTKYVILFKEICFPDPGQCQPYFGDTHYHVHLSVNGGIKDKACG
jgi:hypothetical protein